MNISESNFKDEVRIFSPKILIKRYNKMSFRRFVRNH